MDAIYHDRSDSKYRYPYTHYVRGIAVLNLQQIHRPDHGLHRHENVLVHEFDEASLILVRVAGTVDDPHLLDKGRLARLAGTCENFSQTLARLFESRYQYECFISFSDKYAYPACRVNSNDRASC